MSNLKKLIEAQDKEEFIIIRKKTTGSTGTAVYVEGMGQVKVYTGASDGCEDKWISKEEFNNEYKTIGVER